MEKLNSQTGGKAITYAGGTTALSPRTRGAQGLTATGKCQWQMGPQTHTNKPR